MYEVTNAYKAAVYTTPIYSKLAGVITLTDGRTIDIYDNSSHSNVVAGSVSVNNKAVSKNKLEYGAAYVGELNISIYDDIDRNALYGAEVTLSWYLMVAGGTYEEIPLGVYIINEAVRTKRMVKIVAYDRMKLLDLEFLNTETVGSIYEVLEYISTITGVELAQIDEEIEQLTNGSRFVTISETAGYKTYREIVSDIAAEMCCFATMTRDGKLKFVPFATATTEVINESKRNNTNIAEKIINYDTLRMQVKKSIYTTVKTGQDEGTSLFEMETDVLIGQNHAADYIRETMQNMIDTIAELSYTPASCEIVGNPALDLGDMLRLDTGNSVECYMPIMSYEWKYHGSMKVKAEGADVTEGSSRTSKIAAGTADAVASAENVIFTYENARDYTVRTDFKQIIRIDYVSTTETKGMFNAQILVELSENAEISFKYVINSSQDIYFMPVQTAAVGKHIITLFYPLTAIPQNTANSLRVQMSVSAGTATIAAFNIKAAVSAQGLDATGAEWDGTIEIEETYNTFGIIGITVKAINENINTSTNTPTASTISETFSTLSLGGITIKDFNEVITTAIND